METFQNLSGRDRRLPWALALSLLLHGLLLWLLPKTEHPPLPEPTVLEISLVQPTPPAPQAAEPQPEPPSPEPPKPQPPKPKKATEPVKKTEPKVERSEQAPQPQETTKPAEPAPPPVISVQQNQQPAEVPTPTPPLPPPKQEGPTPQEVDDARNRYGSQLAREIAKYKQYPRIAQMRGWQGDVLLELQMDANGALVSSSVLKSSGYESLDKQALEMVKKASPFPPPPGTLRGRSFTVQVPVNFRLELE